ncbi:MAG: Rz1-like lysis system protein LysC [Pseudomonadota bacterium]
MKRLTPALGCACLTLLLTACASDPVVVTRLVPLLPPSAYLEPCPVSLGNVTLGDSLEGLRATIECDRKDKASLRAWRDEHAAEADDQPQTF